MLACTLALNGGGSSTVSRWMMAPVLSRMIRPIVVIPSPVARTVDRIGDFALGQTPFASRAALRVLALRTNTDTGDAEPGWRFDVDGGRRDGDASAERRVDRHSRDRREGHVARIGRVRLAE